MRKCKKNIIESIIKALGYSIIPGVLCFTLCGKSIDSQEEALPFSILIYFLFLFFYVYVKVLHRFILIKNKKKNEIRLASDILLDLFFHLDYNAKAAFLASMALSYGLCIGYPSVCISIHNDIASKCVVACPTLMGFGITAYIILIKINEKNINKLKKSQSLSVLNNKIRIVSHFYACIIWFILLVFIVLVLALITPYYTHLISVFLIVGFILNSIYMFADIILKLFYFHKVIYFPEDIYDTNNITKQIN